MTDTRWQVPTASPTLEQGHAHVWRIQLNDDDDSATHFANLSHEERTRAGRLQSPHHARRYTIAHGMLRHILSLYTGVRADALIFAMGEFGKPYLSHPESAGSRFAHFNLSHSADLALVAVSKSGEVGVDVEFWRDNVAHLEIAERFFSPAEREWLRALHGNTHGVMRGFFSGWSRKEAYIKASGLGISRGLNHFDMSLEPNKPAILADRHDAQGTTRWAIADIDVGARYSAAIVATAPLSIVRLYDASAFDIPMLDASVPDASHS